MNSMFKPQSLSWNAWSNIEFVVHIHTSTS